MKVDLYAFVGMYDRALGSLSHILNRAAAFAAEKGVSEDEMLGWRLAPDMFDLRRQALVVIDFPVQWVARAAGRDIPPQTEGEPGVEELQALIARSKDFLATVTPEELAGRDEEMLTHNLREVEPTLPIGRWIAGFATTNIYFHLSIAYAILRHKGLDLGKRDLFGGGL